jgi:hypothetical protein
MTDPGDPQSPSSPPSPFNPRPLGPRPGGGGCSKPALLGCGGVLLLLGILAIVFVFKAPDFLRWWFGKLQAQVLSQLPPDLPAADRQRLLVAFKDVDHGIATGKLDAGGLQQMQQKLVQLSSKPNRQLTRQDVLELTEALEHLVGKKPAPAPAEPASPANPAPPASAAPPPGPSTS